MATSLSARSLPRVSLGLLLLSGVLLLPTPGTAAVINDGTTTNDLVRMANAVNWLDESAISTLTPADGALTAAQEGYSLPPLRTTWFPRYSAPTSGVYRVAADFRPAELLSTCQGGVMGWLNTGRSNGIVLYVTPGGAEPGFRVATVDFLAEDPNMNESTANLYNPLDGAPATADFGSSWSELGPGYVATNFATFELTFTAPTAADTNVLSNATARVTARVFQVEGGATNQVSTTIELLTDLPLPDLSAHALGYYAVYASDSGYGSIGDLDNLVADSVGVRPNVLPTVQITSPTPNASFPEPATIALEVDARDSDGSVASVSYFAGATLIGTVSVAPYSLTWSNVPAGNYSLDARATDNRGASTTSPSVNITVTRSSGSSPSLTVTYTPNGILLAWGVTGYQLHYKADLIAPRWTPWSEDTRTLTQITVPYSAGVQFFRLEGAGAGAAPALTIQAANGQVTVSWPAGVTGYRLQAKDALSAAVWTDVPITGNAYSAPVGSGNQFFRLVAAGTPTSPTLAIHVANGQVTVTWPAGVTGYRLQAKDALSTAAWTDVPTSGNTYSTAVTAEDRFYRLIRP